MFSSFSSVLWKDPLHGKERVGNLSEAEQKRAKACMWLVSLQEALGPAWAYLEGVGNGLRLSEGGCLEEHWKAVSGAAQERSLSSNRKRIVVGKPLL